MESLSESSLEDDDSSDDEWDSPAMSERFVSGPAAAMRRAVTCNAYDKVTDLIIDNGFPVIDGAANPGANPCRATNKNSATLPILAAGFS